MAGDKVRRGFLYYLMMLILFAVAIFFILAVIMVFNPGMNLLGLKYFSQVREYRVDEVTADGQNAEDIDLSKATDIVVDGNLINFEIMRDQSIEKTTIRIENYQTGFAKADQSTQFSYNIEYSVQENSRALLSINVTNAEGWIYFNNNCYVKILLPKDEVINATNSLSVSTDAGSIILGGGQKLLTEEDTYYNFSDVTLHTQTGSILIGKYLDCNFSHLSVTNENGSFRSSKDITLADEATLNISGENGSFEFTNISGGEGAVVNYNLTGGSFYATDVDCNVNVKTKNSTMDIQNFHGYMQANDLVNKFDGANITIDKASGLVSLPFANNSNVTIDDATEAKIFIISDNSQLNIDKLAAGSWLETKQGAINVSLANTEGEINLVSESANINIDGNLAMQNQIVAKSITGSITLNYSPQSSFTVSFYNSQGKERKDVQAQDYQENLTNPLFVNGGGTQNSLSTDGAITLRRL